MMAKVSKFAVLAAVASCAMVASTATPSLAWGGCFAHEHPRRAEVLRRDGFLNSEINHDYGYLDGHYGQLKAEDRAIRRQEQFDARMNGGYITRGEQAQLNREENHVQRQINHDLI
jgi:hypothetical protein